MTYVSFVGRSVVIRLGSSRAFSSLANGSPMYSQAAVTEDMNRYYAK
jgi:hypothetical protein